MNYTLSLEEVRMLAQGERDMDSGRVAFVTLHGNRTMVTKPAMKQFQLEQGQTISDCIFREILNFNLAEIVRRKDQLELEQENHDDD